MRLNPLPALLPVPLASWATNTLYSLGCPGMVLSTLNRQNWLALLQLIGDIRRVRRLRTLLQRWGVDFNVVRSTIDDGRHEIPGLTRRPISHRCHMRNLFNELFTFRAKENFSAKENFITEGFQQCIARRNGRLETNHVTIHSTSTSKTAGKYRASFFTTIWFR